MHVIQLLAPRFILFHISCEIIYNAIADYRLPTQRSLQHHSFQSLATAQCYIRLPMSKRVTSIDNRPLKRQTLTLMNRDSPRQTDGILPEHTFYFFRDLLRFFVQHILIIPPFFGQQLKDITTVFSTYGHSFFVNTHHFAYHAVIVTFF